VIVSLSERFLFSMSLTLFFWSALWRYEECMFMTISVYFYDNKSVLVETSSLKNPG
jgi:hypothetical protein